MTILITCAGSGVGQSVIDSLNLKHKHKLIGCDGNYNVYANAFCHKFFIVPGIYAENYVDHLIALCIEESVDLIIPGHDHELLLFSKEIQRFHENNIEVVVSEPEIIEVSRDKLKWYDYFSKYGCRIVPTYAVKAFKKNPDPSIFPAIVKPAGGSASQGISILNDIAELGAISDEDIIQPYLFPKSDDANYEVILKAVKQGSFVQRSEISIQLVFSKESTFSGIFISRNTLKNGVPIFVDPIKPEEFEYLDEIMKFVPVCEEKGVKGPVNIQGRVTEKGLYFFEMNMRFTGITGNRALLGFNEVDFLVNNFLNREAKLEAFSYNKLGVRQVACTTIPRNKSDLAQTYTLLGAGGFVGTMFLESLKTKSDVQRINLICRDSSYERYVARYAGEKVKVFKGTDPFVETIYCQSDVLINFAAALAYYPDEDIYRSIIFQYDHVQKLNRANIPVIINVSSQSVYDQREDTQKNEQTEVHINTAYSFQKYMGEQFFNSLSQNTPLVKAISLRFTRILGGTDRKINGFFAKAVDALSNGEELVISNPENKTNLIDVRDVVNAIHFVILNKNRRDLPGVLNVGGENISLREYSEHIVEVLGDAEKRKLLKLGEDSEVKASSMVDTQLMNSFGWHPQYTVKDLIKSFVDSTENVKVTQP